MVISTMLLSCIAHWTAHHCIFCEVYYRWSFPSSDDEPEGPEDVPEHEQGMRCSKVICTNFSLLYTHLDPKKFLPVLPEKDLMNEEQLKCVESCHQRFAKNVFVIRALLWYDRPFHGLLKFCDTLETTPGQEHLGRKLLKGTSKPVLWHM